MPLAGRRVLSMPDKFEEHAQMMANGYAAPEDHYLYKAVAAFIETAKPLEYLPADDKRSIPNGVWVLCHYFHTYLNDQYEIYVDEHGPVVERSFNLLFWEDEKLRIEIFGQIDLVLKNTITGEILPADHKTTSMMGADFMNRVKPNSQYTGYMWAANRLFGSSAENFLVNAIETKAKPKTARGSPPKFLRQITRRDAHDYEEFHWVVRDAVDSYLRWMERDRWPLGSVDACAMYGACQYLDVCSAPNELRQNILEAKFAR